MLADPLPDWQIASGSVADVDSWTSTGGFKHSDRIAGKDPAGASSSSHYG
jgi:hypothetical protein